MAINEPRSETEPGKNGVGKTGKRVLAAIVVLMILAAVLVTWRYTSGLS